MLVRLTVVVKLLSDIHAVIWMYDLVCVITWFVYLLDTKVRVFTKYKISMNFAKKELEYVCCMSAFRLLTMVCCFQIFSW